MNEVMKTMKKRRMTRKFLNEQLNDEQILDIIEMAQHAPSVQKQQAWNFTIIQNEDLLNEMNSAAKLIGQQSPVEVIRKLNNQDDYHIFYNAPTVVLISARKDAMMPEAECIAAAQNIFISAESMNLGACWVSALNPLLNSEEGLEYRNKLGLDENLIPQLAISLGHIDSRPEKPYPRKEGKYQFVR